MYWVRLRGVTQIFKCSSGTTIYTQFGIQHTDEFNNNYTSQNITSIFLMLTSKRRRIGLNFKNVGM